MALLDTFLMQNQSALSEDSLQWLPIEFLQRGCYQPRREFNTETLHELADSIRVYGIIQPIIVRLIASEKYEIIAGERRWRAAQLVGLEKVPVIVKVLTEQSVMVMALIENIQRDNLNPLEEAEALKKIMESLGLSVQKLADKLGKSASTVANSLRLLTLSEAIKPWVATGQLSMGHARALLTLDAETQWQCAQKIMHKNLTVRATEALVKQIQSPPKTLLNQVIDRDILWLQQELSERLNAPVEIQHKKNGSGKVTIQYSSLDGLEGLLQQFMSE
jgi:ParB family transcriptional regulator, chromosome partitioning protein